MERSIPKTVGSSGKLGAAPRRGKCRAVRCSSLLPRVAAGFLTRHKILRANDLTFRAGADAAPADGGPRTAESGVALQPPCVLEVLQPDGAAARADHGNGVEAVHLARAPMAPNPVKGHPLDLPHELLLERSVLLAEIEQRNLHPPK